MLQELLKQISGNAASSATGAGDALKGIGNGLGEAAGKIPGGLVGGAAAGGLMALLVSSKSTRRFASKVAGYGGAAVLGGLAYNAYRNWKEQQPATDAVTAGASPSDASATAQPEMIPPPDSQRPVAELALIKAMIAAGKADGHLDQTEQQRVFQAVEQMALPADTKGAVFDLLQRNISIEELKAEAESMEQMSEIYLASCLAIDIDSMHERDHLDRLAREFALPEGLQQQLENQARLAIEENF